jgi:uncharacterized membrane protein
MPLGPMNYLPLAPAYFLAMALMLLLLFALIRVWRYAYLRLGLSPGTAILVLAATLIGSYFNIPVYELAPHPVISGRVVDVFGMRYVIPALQAQAGTIVAVNVGGAVIPTLVSLYLIVKHWLWGKGLLAIIVVAAVCHWLAQPVPGLGIAMPIFVPVVTTTIVALVLSRVYAAPLAYIGGSLGVLIGADLLNFGHIQGLGAPVASIGGAGTFDGIFVIGILAVLLASLLSWRDRLRTLERR